MRVTLTSYCSNNFDRYSAVVSPSTVGFVASMISFVSSLILSSNVLIFMSAAELQIVSPSAPFSFKLVLSEALALLLLNAPFVFQHIYIV